MFRIDGPTAAAALPAPAAVSGTPGYFSDGDPLTATPPTTVTNDWANMVQEELIGVVIAAGGTPSKTDHTQLLTALQTLFVAAGGGAGVHIGTDQISVPIAGGFAIKAGVVALPSGSNTTSGTLAFDTAFPTACWAIIGTAQGPANGSWHPIVITFDSPGASGSTWGADTSNSSYAIGAGKSFRWIAIGN